MEDVTSSADAVISDKESYMVCWFTFQEVF